MSDIDKQLEHIYLNVNGKKAFIEATKALISTAVREAQQQELMSFMKFAIGKPVDSVVPITELLERYQSHIKHIAQLKEGVQE